VVGEHRAKVLPGLIHAGQAVVAVGQGQLNQQPVQRQSDETHHALGGEGEHVGVIGEEAVDAVLKQPHGLVVEAV